VTSGHHLSFPPLILHCQNGMVTFSSTQDQEVSGRNRSHSQRQPSHETGQASSLAQGRGWKWEWGSLWLHGILSCPQQLPLTDKAWSQYVWGSERCLVRKMPKSQDSKRPGSLGCAPRTPQQAWDTLLHSGWPVRGSECLQPDTRLAFNAKERKHTGGRGPERRSWVCYKKMTGEEFWNMALPVLGVLTSKALRKLPPGRSWNFTHSSS
jgi:hypothetical protein